MPDPEVKEEKVEGPHDALVNHISDTYYGGEKKKEIKEKILSDPEAYNKALSTIHRDTYHDISFDQFKKKYTEVNGNPFPEKKKSIPATQEIPQVDSSKESGNGVQNQSFLNQALSRIPKGSGNEPYDERKAINDYIKNGSAPDDKKSQELNDYIKMQHDFIRQHGIDAENNRLAEESDKQGKKTFIDTQGKERSNSEYLGNMGTTGVFVGNFSNALVDVPLGVVTLAKSAGDLVGAKSEKLNEAMDKLEEAKTYIPQEANKNIIDNPSDPKAYAALFGQLTGLAATTLATAGVGNALNLSSKATTALQASNILSSTAPNVYQSAKDAGLTDNGAAAMTLVTSPAIAALDMVGMGKLMDNDVTRKLVAKTGMEGIKLFTENFTKKFTPEVAAKVSEYVSKKVPYIIKRVGSNATVEGSTEALQEAISVGSEAAYNNYFKDQNEQGYNLDDWQKRILIAGASGAVGGGAFGVLPNHSPQVQEMTRTKDALVNDLNKETTTAAAKEILNEQIKAIDEQIQAQVKVEQETQAQEQAKKEQVAALETQKEELINNISQEDITPETKSILESKVKDIDNQIQEINPTVEGLNSKRAEILSGLEIDKKSGEPIITPEAQKQLDDIDNQILSLGKTEQKNEIPEEQTNQTTESTGQETKAEAPAIQEGQQLEEAPIESDNGVEPTVSDNTEGFTDVKTINDGFKYIKEKLGDKKAKKYFEQVDTLINPNKIPL